MKRLLGNSDCEKSSVVEFLAEEPSKNHRILNDEGGEKKIDRHCGEAIALEEGHQEAKSNEDHQMNILEHCN